MIGWLVDRYRGLFPAQAPSCVEPPDHASRTRIGYDPTQIAHFKAHHAKLRRLLEELARCTLQRRYDAICNALTAFSGELARHLLDENVRLYAYLKHCQQGDADGADFARFMQIESGRIGRAVSTFARSYSRSGVSDANIEMFSTELGAVANALLNRIRIEESLLYPMYMAPVPDSTRNVAA